MPQENIFEHSLQKSNLLLKDIEQDLPWLIDRKGAYSLFKAVLQTLRDRLTVDEAANFGAQLPLILRGAYYEGWNPSKTPIKFNKDEFIREVERKFPSDPELPTEQMIQAVFKSVRKHTSNEEIENIKDILPRNLASLFPSQ